MAFENVCHPCDYCYCYETHTEYSVNFQRKRIKLVSYHANKNKSCGQRYAMHRLCVLGPDSKEGLTRAERNVVAACPIRNVDNRGVSYVHMAAINGTFTVTVRRKWSRFQKAML